MLPNGRRASIASTQRAEPQQPASMVLASGGEARSSRRHGSMHAQPADAAVGKNVEPDVRHDPGGTKLLRIDVPMVRAQFGRREQFTPGRIVQRPETRARTEAPL